jgi:hypothetical protein
MEPQDPRLGQIWRQARIPVVFRQAAGRPTLVRLPYSEDNRVWVKGQKRHRPRWNTEYKCWETPAAWFDELIRRAIERYGRVYVIQLYREQQKCAPACWNAEGYHCECSCMGANHGTGHPGGHWHEVSETFAFQWGTKKYACRLIAAKSNQL